MSIMLERLTAEALALPPDECEQLQEQLLLSLMTSEIDRDWLEEIRKRKEEVLRGTAVTITPEEAFDRIRESLLSRKS